MSVFGLKAFTSNTATSSGLSHWVFLTSSGNNLVESLFDELNAKADESKPLNKP